MVAELREAVRLRPDSADSHNTLGLVLIQAGDDAAGIASLREAVRLAPDYAEARANLGAALTPTDPDAAVRELERAVALAPASLNAQFNLAVAYGASPAQGVAKEIEQLRKVIALSPTFARAHLALGKALLRDGKVPDAIAELEEAARLEPKSGEAHYQLGLALARAGRKEEASAALAKGRALVAEDDKTQNASLDIAEGQAAMARGALEEAEAKFRHALQLRPDSRDARRYLDTIAERRKGGSDDPARVAAVEAHIRQGQFKEVEPLLAEYVKERPQSSWAWYALGYSLFAQQTHRRIHQGAGQVARARRHQRRGPQDPRPQPDDHRPLRRRADRVRAGDPLQAGFGGEPLQPRQALLDPGHLGAGAQGVRSGAPDRPGVHRSDRCARLRARSAGRR